MIRSMRLIEALAVVLQLSYTALYILNHPSCWYFALVGSALFSVLCFSASLFAESALHIFYIGMAIYGLVTAGQATEWYKTPWSADEQLILIVFSGILTYGLGRVLKVRFNGAMPYLDAGTTVFSVSATWLMVNYVHDNWLYWIVIDGVSVYLYAKRGMFIAAWMFLVYLVLSIVGYFQWI